MVNLCEYDNATYEECIEDLNEVLAGIYDMCDSDGYYDDLDTLRRKGLRIQNIAQRLKDLEENNEN